MPEDLCVRARRLVEQDAVEGISAEERGWLERHLESCEACSGVAEQTRGAIRLVRSSKVEVPKDLAFRTQFRVSLRAQELRAGQRGWILWGSLGLSWAVGVVSAPWVWRTAEWAVTRVGLPPSGATLMVGLWWAAPAAIAAGIWVLDRAKVEEQ
jgi:anti-sigma factor RsiW